MREQNIDELLTWSRCHQPWLAAVFACIGNHGTAAFFGDTNGIVYAVKIDDGSLLWKVHADPHPAARITGSPLLIESKLYVPVSSGEEGASSDPSYPCCTFRGSVAALDPSSGKQLWRAYMIDELPKPMRKSAQGVQYSRGRSTDIFAPMILATDPFSGISIPRGNFRPQTASAPTEVR